MGTYSPEVLREMARIVLADRNEHGECSFQLILILSMKLDINPDEVLTHILELTKNELRSYNAIA